MLVHLLFVSSRPCRGVRLLGSAFLHCLMAWPVATRTISSWTLIACRKQTARIFVLGTRTARIVLFCSVLLRSVLGRYRIYTSNPTL